MAAYVAGDQKLFAQLVARYAPQIMRVMLSRRIPEADAQELTQQTFLQLHRARKDYRVGAPLRPWLMTIAYNLLRDHLRWRKRRSELPIDHAAPVSGATQADALERHEQILRLRRALVQLPEVQRTVIELHWFGHLSFKEIATAVGASVSAVKVRAHRGYRNLRQIMDNDTCNPNPARP